MAPLVPLLISPAGSWWWLRTAANATLPGGASPRAAPPGPPAAARPGSQTTRHSPSSRTGSAPSWAHPHPKVRSISAKGTLGLSRRPGNQCRFAPSMAEGLCDPQILLSPAPSCCSFQFPLPSDSLYLSSAPQPSLWVSVFPGLSISLHTSLCPTTLSVLLLSPAVTAVPSSLAGYEVTAAVGL